MPAANYEINFEELVFGSQIGAGGMFPSYMRRFYAWNELTQYDIVSSKHCINIYAFMQLLELCSEATGEMAMLVSVLFVYMHNFYPIKSYPITPSLMTLFLQLHSHQTSEELFRKADLRVP